MELKIVKSLAEYKDVIYHIKTTSDNIWYRGMSNAKYYLTPSLFREKKIIGNEYIGRGIDRFRYRKSDAVMKSDIDAIDIFITEYKKLHPKKCKNYNLIDYLYIMQHYGIPTRLLDFTTNEFIALFFSVSEYKSVVGNQKDEIDEFYDNYGFSSSGSSVHCINPIFTNENTNPFVNITDDILDIDNIDKKSLLSINLPLCIKTKNKDKRITAQSGVFVLFGNDYKSYEGYSILKKKTIKIFIPNSCREVIKRELKEEMNISHKTVYPDMKGIALDIVDTIEEKYRKDCKNIFG